MHLSVRLPKVDPLHIEPPTRCPLRDSQTKKKCTGTHCKEHQVNCRKPLYWPKTLSTRNLTPIER